MSTNDGVVRTIGGGREWAGERMSEKEINQAVAVLEAWIVDIRSQFCRGFVIAGVGEPGIGATYRTNRFMSGGASRTNIIGALHLLTHRLEAEFIDEEEEV